MRDELIDLQLALQVVINKVRQLAATLYTTESASPPDTSGDELERY